MVKVNGLEAFASFDYFFPGSPLKYWEINANATYKVPGMSASFAPYVGAGLNYAHTSVNVPLFGNVSGSSTGLNLLAGARYPMGKLNLFGEVKFELHTGSQLVVTAGALF
jgi:opacity protein-like surface antigen